MGKRTSVVGEVAASGMKDNVETAAGVTEGKATGTKACVGSDGLECEDAVAARSGDFLDVKVGRWRTTTDSIWLG